MRQTRRSFRMDEAPRADMRRLVEEGVAGADLRAEAVEDLLLAVWEACAQATSHSGDPEVEVTVLTGEHAVEIEIRNPGVFQLEEGTAETRADARLGDELTTVMSMSLVDEYHVDPGSEEHPATRIRLVKLTGS